MRRGKLIGLGVGPGDPELLTIKAVKALEAAGVVAFIATAGRASRAREIAGGYVRAGIRELVAVMPMGADIEATNRAYGQLLTGIVGELGQGNDVVFLCEGDPLLYGSFAHLVERLGSRFESMAIPGITSMTAASALAMKPLAVREQALAILPATLPPARLTALLREVERVVILKVGRHLAKVRQALDAARMSQGALLIENVTNKDQRMRPLAEVGDDAVPYFSLILAGRQPPQAKAAPEAKVLRLAPRERKPG